MVSLRFYNFLSILVYITALSLLYTLVLPVTDIVFYLASISLNLIPYFMKYNVKGVKFKDVKLFPNKGYMGLYFVKTKEILISSNAIDMPDVFLFIKYHEIGHSKQTFDLTYYISRNLSPFALSLHINAVPSMLRKYRLLIRLLASIQLTLFITQFTGLSFITPMLMLITLPIVEAIGAIIYILSLLFFFIGLLDINFLLSMSLLYILLLFYIGYTIPSLAYEIDADSYAARVLKERVLIGYQLFMKRRFKTSYAILSLPLLLISTHPLGDFEYMRLKRLVKTGK